MTNSRVLVTGGAGFIGSHLVDRLLLEGHDVIVLDNLLRKSKLSQQTLDHIRFEKIDVRDAPNVDALIKGCQVVFHLAAYLGVDIVAEHPVEAMEVETIGTKNIVKSSLSHSVEKLIYISTSGVYGKVEIDKAVNEEFLVSPTTSYAIAKRYNEIYLQSIFQEYDLQCFSLRYFNVYGPRQDARMVIPRFFAQAIDGSPITIYGEGLQTRDFTYIDDIIDGTVGVAQYCTGCEIINIANSMDTRIIDIAKMIVTLTKSDSELVLLDPPIGRDEFEVQKRCGSSDKLHALTGFRPKVPLSIGLEKTHLSVIDHGVEDY